MAMRIRDLPRVAALVIVMLMFCVPSTAGAQNIPPAPDGACRVFVPSSEVAIQVMHSSGGAAFNRCLTLRGISDPPAQVDYDQATAWLAPPGLQPLYLKRMRAVTAAPEGGLIVVWGPSFEDQQAASIAQQLRAYPNLPEYSDVIENDPDLSFR